MIQFIFTNRPDQHRRDREQDERPIPIKSWNHPPRSSTELDPSLNTHPILLSIRPIQPPSASAVLPPPPPRKCRPFQPLHRFCRQLTSASRKFEDDRWERVLRRTR
ncbi:hypothetical protein F2Q70_00030215 [Brassica cretica]|uniref:Uncharacterized protein n=1 Tax=Brassica cretica TaxID=69181 RepID=A0A8S9FE76_BRACR|nr:hypothetical protein F2Q70_00030215 [Brassica cretica]KAF3597079.1 hypothetical protein DY000_02022594 [Brassica cretica]